MTYLLPAERLALDLDTLPFALGYENCHWFSISSTFGGLFINSLADLVIKTSPAFRVEAGLL
jgi:hypothetical protein